MAVLSIAVATGLVGCEGGIGRGLPSSIANTILVMQLGPVGRFISLPNTRIRNVADVQPFSQRPTDNPTSGQMRLRSSSVTVLPAPSGSGKIAANYQASLNGTARLRVVLDQPGAVSPCDTGIEVGTFQVAVQNGVVTDISDDLSLSLGAISLFLGNNMSICLEMEANFPATINIDSIDVNFGPSNGTLRGTFELKNSSFDDIEIIGPGESPCTTDSLAPGARRESVYTNLEPNQDVTFHAVGPDCQIIDSVTCSPIDRDRYVAIVTWTGTRLECLQIIGVSLPPIDPPIDEPPDDGPTTEACCLPDPNGFGDICLNLDIEECFSRDGTALGEGTRCDSRTCESPACCFQDPTECIDLLAEDCELFGGDFQGFGVFCDSDPCGEDDEACCLDDGTCVEGPPTACIFAGGTPQGIATTCTDGFCSGACCLTNGTCVDTSQNDCTTRGGTFKGLGTDCSQGWCVGACCEINRPCALRTEQQCNDIGGIFRGERMPCAANTCATVACCLPFAGQNSCFQRDAAECTMEGGVSLGPIACPSVCPIGACCAGGACSLQTAVNCGTGVYLGDGTGCTGVAMNECPDRQACCFSDGTCQNLAEAECAVMGGQPKGDGTACTPGLCAATPTVGTLTGVVTDASNGQPLVGAIIRVDRSPTALQTRTRGPGGNYSLAFPDLPDFFALSASEIGYIPQTIGVSKAAAISSPQPINFALQPVTRDVVVIEAIPDVHHLGNDSFSGSVNSQFQKSAEGGSYTKSFDLAADQVFPTISVSTLRMLHKGSECPNLIEINGTALGTSLSGAPGDGSFGEFTVTLPVNLLVAGANSITISARDCFGGTSGDLDDFEFVNAQFRLSP